MADTSRDITLRVQRIQRFCLYDGPGIRTTLFTQGCALRCWWCHNPETQRLRDGAARDWPVDMLAKELERDRRFFTSSGGGVTLCGGEPLLQAGAVTALLTDLGQRGIHRTVDTSGYAPRIALQRIAPQVDLWLWDVKHTDASRFVQGTGGSVSVSLNNLIWLLRTRATPVRARLPVIAGFNDDTTSLSDIGGFLASLPRPIEIELLRGHDVGRGVDAGVERSAQVSDQRVLEAGRILRALGLAVVDHGKNFE